MLKRKRTKESGSQAPTPEENQKGITCGTAVGAKQGRTKGNKQKAKYRSREGMHERSGRIERGEPKKRERKGHLKKPL